MCITNDWLGVKTTHDTLLRELRFLGERFPLLKVKESPGRVYVLYYKNQS